MKKFNVRVYGLLIQDNCLLVSDEYINNVEMTKLPGGGLEFGEGAIDCVKREFKEELNLSIDVLEHFYTTDFFVQSAFSIDSQVISIYYFVKALEELNIRITTNPFDFEEKKNGAQAFRFISLDTISENDFTFAIDKKVAVLLKFKYK
jgi:ADP-ribose pyrophosphatase YjhB (NUDIX family)